MTFNLFHLFIAVHSLWCFVVVAQNWDWSVIRRLKVVWKYFTMDRGEPCATMHLMTLMLKSPATASDSGYLLSVHLCFWRDISQVKVKKSRALNESPSPSYEVSFAIWDHTVLCASRHKWTHPTATPAGQTGTRFTHLGQMKGWVNEGNRLHTDMVYSLTDRLKPLFTEENINRTKIILPALCPCQTCNKV